MQKNVAGQIVAAHMITIADGSDFGGTVEVFVTGDNGTQTAGTETSGEAVDKGNGLYTYTPSQAETNFDHVVFTFVGTGAYSESVALYPTSVVTTVQSISDRIPLSLGVGGAMKADMQGILGQALDGSGTVNDPWGPAT